MSVKAAVRFCAAPGCATRVVGGYCPRHHRTKRVLERRYQHGTTAYNGIRWIRLRNAYRIDHPFCVNAGTDDRCTLVTEEIDHIIPHRGDEALMYDVANLQPMCKRCHSRKTLEEVR